MNCPKCNEDILSMSVHSCHPKPDLEGSGMASESTACSIRELIEDELRDLWQWGYDQEPREESVQPRLDAIMRIIEANA